MKRDTNIYKGATMTAKEENETESRRRFHTRSFRFVMMVLCAPRERASAGAPRARGVRSVPTSKNFEHIPYPVEYIRIYKYLWREIGTFHWLTFSL